MISHTHIPTYTECLKGGKEAQSIGAHLTLLSHSSLISFEVSWTPSHLKHLLPTSRPGCSISSIFCLVFPNQYREMLLSHSIPFKSSPSPPLPSRPRRHLHFPPPGPLFLMNCHLATVCILPSAASSSSPSENGEIQYELLSLLQGQAERDRERERRREINIPESEGGKSGGGVETDKIYTRCL